MPPPLLDWPRVGLQPLNDFYTEYLVAISFPELFMDEKANPTTKVWRQYVYIYQAIKYLMKVAFKVDRDDGTEEYVYL